MRESVQEQAGNHYADIMDLPHHVSGAHPQMSNYDRAAQFSPFAALTGHEDAIREAQRLTTHKAELSENTAEELDRKLQMLKDALAVHPMISVTYFRQDERKDGGSYLTERGRLSRMLPSEKALQLETGVRIPFADILEINGEMFQDSLF